MKIAILGFGREGKAVLEFLRKSPKYDFAQFWVLDKNSKLKVPIGLKKRLGKNYLKKLRDFNIVFRSPGVPFNLPEIQDAVKHNVVFSSATKLFFENFSGRIIGVTGTKGKGTTSTLIYQILKNSGHEAFLAGNIGWAALEILPQLKQHSLVVLELSSFQLQDATISPTMAVVLDIFPDHLDTHKNFKEYLAAKMNISRYQTGGNKVFYFRNNKYSLQVAKKGLAKKIAVPPARFSLFKKDDLKIPGEHNFRNALMAATVASHLDCPKEKVIETVKNFTGLEHRLEFVRSWRGPAGTIAFYNDSASTNPQTTMAAVQAFDRPLVLIAGGYDKGLDFAPLGKIIRSTKTTMAVIFGANKEKIKKALKRFPVVIADNLPSALQTAIHHSHGHSIIVFSPGAASFDMFQNYADRGRQFKALVNNL